VCDPAHLDEPEEGLATEQTVVLMWDARAAGAIEGKVVDFDSDACCKESVNLLFGRLFDVADVVGDFGWCGRGSLGIMGAKKRLRTMGGGRGSLGHVGRG
jgi:hypothetical protein